MRNNGHITHKEVPLSPQDEIVSSTDIQGNILFCNDTFCKVSGYSREELLQQPHNILRHPQMPREAFSMLWTALKAGKPWMGMVKNRCKNGDHYWVSAYVTPLRDHGQIQGYESVRVKADSAWVMRAGQVYQRLLDGKPLRSPWGKLWSQFGSGFLVTAATFILLTLANFFIGALSPAAVGAALMVSLIDLVFNIKYGYFMLCC